METKKNVQRGPLRFAKTPGISGNRMSFSVKRKMKRRNAVADAAQRSLQEK
jgi:hypothetical protein